MAVALDRPDEVAAAIAGFIAAQLGLAGGRVHVELQDIPASGNSNVTVPLTARWRGASGHEHSEGLVLRMQTSTNQIFLDADVVREARVLAALHDTPVPAPRVRWVEPGPHLLGHPFFLMERVDGTVPHGKPSIHADGWLPGLAPDIRDTVWRSAIDTLAAVHAVDSSVGHQFLAAGPTGATLEPRLAHLRRWYEWVTDRRSFPITNAALDHLDAQLPRLDPGPPVLCWGDPRVGNMMFAADGRCAAVLDWELASIGPAEVDLGWWLAMEEFQTGAHGVEPLPGWPDRDATIARYEATSGRRVAPEVVVWGEILAAWVLTVTVIRMADIAVARGTLPAGTRMGHGNLTAQMLARRLDLPVPPLDPDYARRRGLAAP